MLQHLYVPLPGSEPLCALLIRYLHLQIHKGRVLRPVVRRANNPRFSVWPTGFRPQKLHLGWKGEVCPLLSGVGKEEQARQEQQW